MSGSATATLLFGEQAAGEPAIADEPDLLALEGRPLPVPEWVARTRDVAGRLRAADLSREQAEHVRREVSALVAGFPDNLYGARRRDLIVALLGFIGDAGRARRARLAELLTDSADWLEIEQLTGDPRIYVSRLLADFGLTDEDLAEAIGVRPATVRRWIEKGSTPKKSYYLCELARCGYWLRRAGFGDAQMNAWLHRKAAELGGCAPIDALRQNACAWLDVEAYAKSHLDVAEGDAP